MYILINFDMYNQYQSKLEEVKLQMGTLAAPAQPNR